MKSSKKKIVTVIVAAYKAEDFILECLDSIVKQKLPRGWRLQLILGIDCCEETRKVVEKLRASPPLNHSCVEVYYMQKNRGTYVTFNTMMQFAKGSVVCRFDADDVMYQDMLKEGLKEIKEQADYIQFKCNHEKGGGQVISANGVVMFTRKTWDLLGGYQPWICSADTNYLRSAEKAELSICDISEALFLYRDNPLSLTNKRGTNFKSKVRQNFRDQILKNKNFDFVKTVPLTSSCRKLN